MNTSTPKLNALPLYAGLPSSEQLAVFQAAQEGERKVIVATNVAEASVTIDGIVYVIDCGFVKVTSLSIVKLRHSCAHTTPEQALNPSSWPQYPKPPPSKEPVEPAAQNPETVTVSTQNQHTHP
jgi:hypothetical protein